MPRKRPTEDQYRSADVPGKRKIFNPLTGAMCYLREDAVQEIRVRGGGGTKTGLWEGGDDGGMGYRASGWSGGSVGMSPAQLNEALTRHLLGFEDTKNIMGTSNIIKPTGEVKPLRVHLNGNWDCPQCDRENDHFLTRCLDCNTSKYDQTANLNIKASSKRVRVIQSHSCPDCGWLHFHKNEVCIGCGKVNETFRANRLKNEALQRRRNPTGLDKTLADGFNTFMEIKRRKAARERGTQIETVIEEDSEDDENAPPPPEVPHPEDEPLQMLEAPPDGPPPPPDALGSFQPPPPPDAQGNAYDSSDEETKRGDSQALTVASEKRQRGTPTNSDSDLSDSSDSDDDDLPAATRALVLPCGAPRRLDLFNTPEVEDSDSDE